MPTCGRYWVGFCRWWSLGSIGFPYSDVTFSYKNFHDFFEFSSIFLKFFFTIFLKFSSIFFEISFWIFLNFLSIFLKISKKILQFSSTFSSFFLKKILFQFFLNFYRIFNQVSLKSPSNFPSNFIRIFHQFSSKFLFINYK